MILRHAALALSRKIVCNASMTEGKKYEIAVKVHTTYLPEQSDEALDRYVFAYTIVLSNTGTVTAQLISRHWVIADGSGGVQEVRGLGVVGEQPLLKPGDSYEYTSGTAISTPVGSMKGSYQMVAEDGLRFDAPIPEFILSVPRILH
ncbi:ApaG protein [Nitrosospira multiformis]|uniref:Protein ApaG n=2 Tax=Nitrosospira multiformis TaxID=1231 RepID=A0A1I0CA96_9PROT|nr:ApaG protein [Nitrosospira multiformis]